MVRYTLPNHFENHYGLYTKIMQYIERKSISHGVSTEPSPAQEYSFLHEWCGVTDRSNRAVTIYGGPNRDPIKDDRSGHRVRKILM